MQSNGTVAWCLLGIAFVLGACTGAQRADEIATSADRAGGPYPANYKSDILAALRVYLRDPTNIRDAGLSEPVLQPVGRGDRYVACLRFDAKKSNGEYAGTKDHVAIFTAGRLDRLTEAVRDQCAAATVQPFPEAEKLSR